MRVNFYLPEDKKELYERVRKNLKEKGAAYRSLS
jgi:hypothetical protein